ncbi:MAG: class II aldolase/adducin family protein [Anaerolineae bacterium]
MPPSSFPDILEGMGDAGQRMAEMGASEGAAGNISVYVRDLTDMDSAFVSRGLVDLPVAVPHLGGGYVVITATGRRLGDVTRYPQRSVGVLHVCEGGTEAEFYAAQLMRPTSEMNSHLAVHNDHVGRRGLAHHAVLHAQPIRLSYLSHVPAYATTETLSRRLFRWQPEMIVEFPEGIGVLPFELPGSAEQMNLTVEGMARHRAVLWQRHGIVTRDDNSIGKAADLVDYAETAAQYEVLNLLLGQPTEGLSDTDLRRMIARMGIVQTLF